MSDIKLCKDCKYCEPNGFSANEFSKCAHPTQLSQVTGKATNYCDLIRSRMPTQNPICWEVK